MKQTDWNLPSIAYGAVYFRKSGPPREDWERDYAQAARDGMNTFRHWFLWGAIEVAPGEYDWDDYDAQLELGARHNIKTIVAECLHAAPEWAFRQFAHARYQTAEGLRNPSQMRNSSATGGFPGLCFDNEDWKTKGEEWLRLLVNRYQDHRGMGGYDIWNECNLHSSAMPYCYCGASKDKFRAWLKAKYGDLKTLGGAWRRYSYASWEDVEPPRGTVRNNEFTGDLFPDFLDWTRFRVENAHRLMKWRVDVVRSLDSRNFVSCHGVHVRALNRRVSGADDGWKASELCDGYGYTGGCSYHAREMEEPIRWRDGDMTRSGAGYFSDGDLKPFWAAERAAGPSWSNKSTQPRFNGRLPQAADLRVADLTALACGATGLFSSRWRPLLDGPLFDHYAYYAMDGAPTVRSKMAAQIAKWANAPERADLWRSQPVQGDIGILVVPETQEHLTLMRGSDFYASAVLGAYQALHANHLQADFVPLERLDSYDLIYLPLPCALSRETVETLKTWVANGGTLISEGHAGYWNDHARADILQPGQGLHELFGAQQDYAEFAPELLAHELSTFGCDGTNQIAAGGFLQTFTPTSGTIAGRYEGGPIPDDDATPTWAEGVAVVDHTFGKGRTRLIGTSPGMGYASRHDAPTRTFFASLMHWAKREPHLRCAAPNCNSLLQARLHSGAGGLYLWLINGSNSDLEAAFALSKRHGAIEQTRFLWGKSDVHVEGQTLRTHVPRMDALVLQLRSSKD